ncbi:MAG: polyribonucleotide nucleotidyltransferase [Planctomycetes bacterium]|nr:polyribonucleotide nucleotidyltransferase [Planctomycetota bacterium]
MIGDKPLIIESGKLAKLASGAAWVQYGDTVVFAAAVLAAPRPNPFFDDDDFFPLTCDYRERTAAAGKFPGGFIKRENRPSTKEILTSRLCDRPIRPLFPEGFKNEVQIQIAVLSADMQNDPDVLAGVAASAALAVSDAPFLGPIGCVRVGRVEGNFIVNPTHAQLDESDLDLVIAGTDEAVTMCEGSGLEISEDVMVAGIEFGHKWIKEICRIQKELKAACGKPRMAFEGRKHDPALVAKVASLGKVALEQALTTSGKKDRSDKVKAVKTMVVEKLAPVDADGEPTAGVAPKDVKHLLGELEYDVTRELIVHKGLRADGRGPRDIRPISCEVGILPRAHGSALFTRGETQALVTLTLGTADDEQVVDGAVEDEYSKKFYLHYNFPSYSVNEAKAIRGPGRREIGHGDLAERAILGVIPPPEEFPYTTRILSDILESNGSSSMATVCGGTLALLDAGVKITRPVAGIAMGLIVQDNKVEIISDILGSEDKFGDMDFKVAGTTQGITAFQMDLKNTGISSEIMKRALAQAKEGRVHILGEMAKCMSAPRADYSAFAPRLWRIQLPSDKIGAVIGPGGKVIRGLEEETGAKLEIDDDGVLTISSKDLAALEMARRKVETVIEDVEVGAVYKGQVVQVREFGAIVKLPVAGGTEGMCHVSELAEGYVKNVEDVVKIGDELDFKVISVEDGRIRLSRKALLPRPLGPDGQPIPEAPRPDRGPRRDGPPRGGGGGGRGGPRGGGGGGGGRR